MSNYLGLLVFDRNERDKNGVFCTRFYNEKDIVVSLASVTALKCSLPVADREISVCENRISVTEAGSLSDLSSLLFEKHSLVGRDLGNRSDMNRTLVATLEKEDFVDFLRVYQ